MIEIKVVKKIMVEEKIMVHLQYGLQGRIAAEFVQIASSFTSGINLIKNGRSVDSKSIMGVMSLAIRKGEDVTIIIDGKDEQKAIGVLGDFLLREN
jgi:catabolite repression HPr-like protein/phosphocarrier protein